MLAKTGAISPSKQALTVRIIPAGSPDLPCAQTWDALSSNAAEPNPFFERWFLAPALNHLPMDAPVHIACVYEGERLVGLLPLTTNSHYGRTPVHHLTNWTHYQCFLGVPLIAKGMESPIWAAIIEALDASASATSFVTFTLFDPEGPVFAGLNHAARNKGRNAPVVHRHQRALLTGGLDAETYLATHVRSKKRKEWRRLAHRLEEMGAVKFTVLNDPSALGQWCSDFLAMEAAGWKGARGAALAKSHSTRRFFEEMMADAAAVGRLEFQRLDLDGRAIAMLINFLTPPGSWSFKIAYDEELARFSPGVMIELRNMERFLSTDAAQWMDSCAVENHPMIDSLWADRREIVQVSIPLSGVKRRLIWNACRAAEIGFASLKKLSGKRV